jgi:O-antigen ligase
LLRVLEVGILLAATAATGSRGVFVAAIAAIVAAVIVPDRRIRRQSARLLALGIVSSLGLALISASFRDRLETFRLGFAAGGARTSFVRAGWEMFLDRPIAGHGLGGYAENLLGRYSSFQSYYGGDVVASHTALVTTLAETGLIGIVGTFVVVVVVVWLLDTALRTTDVAHRSLSIGIALSCVVIFVASQAEGRFVEEPLLYPLVGLLAVCARSALPPSSPRTRW